MTQPFILPDATSPATLAELADELGDRKMTARLYGDRFGRPKDEWPGYCDFLSLSIAEYAALLESREAHERRIYLAQIPVDGRLQRSADAAGARLGLGPMTAANLWLGPGGHVEPLHYDPMDGTLVQLHGAKRVRLAPPAASADLYPFPVLGGALRPWFSRASLHAPDFERFPRLRQALDQVVEFELQAGDALYIPAGWWHEVTTLGEGHAISVNRFWKVRPLSRLLAVKRGPLLYAAFYLRKPKAAAPPAPETSAMIG